jgi:hypothetical protein
MARQTFGLIQAECFDAKLRRYDQGTLTEGEGYAQLR